MWTSDQLYEKLKDVKIGGNTCMFTRKKCEAITPVINRINALKAEKNTVILAHSYVTPDIIYGVADVVGDSLKLSQAAQHIEADTILFSAVRFMGETAKILNPAKRVLIPNKNNGCSLADSIDGPTLRELKRLFPQYIFVCYINTTAEVKAECDVCVTSSNVYDIVEHLPNDKIYFIPDKLMGQNLQVEMKRRGVKKDIQIYDGMCYVHEKYEPEMIQYIKLYHPEVRILAHPECKPEVIALADMVGSTAQMLTYVKASADDTFLLLTECGLVSCLEAEVPNKTFVGSCTLCKYMKDNTLDNILRVLENPDPEDEILLDEDLMNRARACVEAMMNAGQHS